MFRSSYEFTKIKKIILNIEKRETNLGHGMMVYFNIQKIILN